MLHQSTRKIISTSKCHFWSSGQSLKNSIKSLLAVGVAAVGGNKLAAATSEAQFCEKNGLVVMEAENTEIPAASKWRKRKVGDGITVKKAVVKRNASGKVIKKDGEFVYVDRDGNEVDKADRIYDLIPPFEGYSGDSYIEYYGGWGGTLNPATKLTYKVQINNPGTYFFKWHTRNGASAILGDESNDSWLNIEADRVIRHKSGTDEVFNTADDIVDVITGDNFKFYVQSMDKWKWGGAPEVHHSPGGRVEATFNSPGVYSINVHGRSTDHVVDKIVLYNESLISYSQAVKTSNPETLFEPVLTVATPVKKKVTQEMDLAVSGTVDVVNEVITKVELYFDNVMLSELVPAAGSTAYNFTVPAAKMTPGAHTFYVKAYSSNDRTSMTDIKSLTATSELPVPLIADAYIEQGRGVVDDTRLKIDAGTRTGYLQFDFSSLVNISTMRSMILKMRVSTDAGNGTVLIRRGNHSNWTEKTLSPANTPVAESRVIDASTGLLKRGTVYTYDLSTLLRDIQSGADPLDNGKLTLMLSMAAGADNVTFGSSTSVINELDETGAMADVSYSPELIVATVPFVKQFTVTFKAGSYGRFGNGSASQIIPQGSSAVAPEVIPVSHMKFIGWDRSFNSVSSDFTVTARYALALNGEGSNDAVERPPVQDGLYLWLNAGVRVERDAAGKVFGWQNLVNGQMLYPGGDVKPTHVTKRLSQKSYDGVRFDGWSFFDYDNPGAVDGPVTVFVTYAREPIHNETSHYFYDQRFISSLGSMSNSDQAGRGFNGSTGKNLGTIAPTTYSFTSSAASLKKMCIGASRSNHTQGFKGDVLEILVYNKLLTGDQRSAMTTRLNEKWNDLHSVEFKTGSAAQIIQGESVQQVPAMQSAVEPVLQMVDNSKKHVGWDAAFDEVAEAMTINAVYEDYPLSAITLKEGYNLVYLNVDPIEKSLEVILDPIKELLVSVTDIDGKVCRYNGDDTWSNGIGEWNALTGYMIKVAKDVAFNVAGPYVQTPPSLQLEEGVNIVPYTGDLESDPLEYFKSVLTDAEYIRDEDGNSLRKIGIGYANDLVTVKPGKSYIVKMKKGGELIFP